MRYLLTVFFCMLLFVSFCFADRPFNDAEEKDKVSYSIGYQVGSDFKRQEIEIRPGMLLKGIQDALGNQTPAMTKKEMRETLVELQKKVTSTSKQSREQNK